MSDDPYARFYHRFAKEYKDVYGDDHLLATWARLLMLADASWPLRPPMPRSAKLSYVRRLVEIGVVILDGDAYTILGLDAERMRRSEAGRAGAAKRWQSDSNAIALPSRAKQSKAETSTARARPNGAAHGAVKAGATLASKPFQELVGWTPEFRPVPKPGKKQ